MSHLLLLLLRFVSSAPPSPLIISGLPRAHAATLSPPATGNLV